MDISYFDYLVNQVKLRPSDINARANDHQIIECLLCQQTFTATPKSKVQNYRKHGRSGCPDCTAKATYASFDKANEQRLLDMGYLLLEPYNGLKKKILISNPKCECGGTPWFTTPERIFSGRSFCNPCNTKRKRQRYLDINEERTKLAILSKQGFEQYRFIVRGLTETTYLAHKSKINPHAFTRALAGKEGYHLDHIVPIRYCFDHNIPPEICADYRNLQMVKWKDNITKNRKPIGYFPDIFYPFIPTMEKLDLFNVTVRQHVNLTFESYVDFNHYTLTLFSADHQAGLLFISLNEYREQVLQSSSHFVKMKEFFEELGIRVLYVFEDEWANNPQLILSKIRHCFNVSDVPIIHARKCIIKPVNNAEKQTFLNAYHIQGTAPAKVSLGAYAGDELVAVMTFSNPRVITDRRRLGVEKQYIWEMVRFATSYDYRIVGIASRLLKYFERHYEWKEIYSFADRRWGNGNLYTQLGFELKKINGGDYFYIIDGKRMHRFNYRKDVLKRILPNFDKTQSEYYNMRAHGYDRIWDCGTLKFTKRNHNLD